MVPKEEAVRNGCVHHSTLDGAQPYGWDHGFGATPICDDGSRRYAHREYSFDGRTEDEFPDPRFVIAHVNPVY